MNNPRIAAFSDISNDLKNSQEQIISIHENHERDIWIVTPFYMMNNSRKITKLNRDLGIHICNMGKHNMNRYTTT